MLTTLSRLAVLAGVLLTAALPIQASGPSDMARGPDVPAAELIDLLKTGGYVIYIRHAQTEADYADQVSAIIGDCSTQRMLSEAGWRQARGLGEAISAAGIPVGDVVSSEYCRAWQTADLAFGKYAKTPALNFAPAEDYSDAQIATMRDNVLPLLLAAPAPGVNTVIVGHDDPFDAATGIYPEPQGVAYVVSRAADGSLTVHGHIAPDAWPAP